MPSVMYPSEFSKAIVQWLNGFGNSITLYRIARGSTSDSIDVVEPGAHWSCDPRDPANPPSGVKGKSWLIEASFSRSDVDEMATVGENRKSSRVMFVIMEPHASPVSCQIHPWPK